MPKEIIGLIPETKLTPIRINSISPTKVYPLEELEKDLIQQALEKARHNKVLATKF